MHYIPHGKLCFGREEKRVELLSCDVRPLPSFLCHLAEQIYGVKQIKVANWPNNGIHCYQRPL